MTQAPRHSTSVMVNMPSALVSPKPWMPVASRQAAVTSSEPRSQHGVVVQTCKWIFADRLQVEHEIEGGDFIDADRRHAQPARDGVHRRAAAPRRCRSAASSGSARCTAPGSPRWPACPADISPRCQAISASLSASNAKCAGCSKSALLFSAIAYLSISPNTTSSDPMIAQTSASMCRLRHHVDRLQEGEAGRRGSCSDTAGWCRPPPDRRRTRPSGFPSRCRSRRPARDSPRCRA